MRANTDDLLDASNLANRIANLRPTALREGTGLTGLLLRLSGVIGNLVDAYRELLNRRGYRGGGVALIECAANLALQGGVKSADANGVLSAVNRAFAVVRCTGG
jgi:hypothetical protein